MAADMETYYRDRLKLRTANDASSAVTVKVKAVPAVGAVGAVTEKMSCGRRA
jgi:hypothetical protein